jgi:hypothetical protein
LLSVVVIATIVVSQTKRDNGETIDGIEVRRPALAKSYLGLLEAQPGRPQLSAMAVMWPGT